MGVFKVLMWKHLVVRKRRYIQTFIELATPFSLILTVFILKEPMQRKVGGSKTRFSDFPVSSFSLDATASPSGILYIPDSEAAFKLMVEVTNALNNFAQDHDNRVEKSSPKESVTDKQAYSVSVVIAIRNVAIDTPEGPPLALNKTHRIKSMSFPNATAAVESLILLTSRSKFVYAMVEFENMAGTELPDVLSYTIRMSALMSTQPTVRFQRLFEKFENVPQSFLPLQWAIDRSFIKLKARNDSHIVKKVQLQPLSNETLKWTLNKTYVSTVFFLLTYISFGAPMLPYIFLMNRLIEERATGIQELVKMVGVTPTMLAVTQLLNSLPACLIYCVGGVVLMKATATPMVPYTHPLILFTGQFLHFMTMIVLAFACSNLSSDAQHTISMSLLLYIGLWIPIKLIGPESKYDCSLFFLGLLPHCPAYWFLSEAMVAEIRYETGIQFDKLTKRFSVFNQGEKNGCVLASFGMQLLQITMFSCLAWFLGKVKPGKYGIAKPWNFLFTKEYWKTRIMIPQDVPMQETAPYDPAYSKYFEEPPNHMNTGIRIQRVSKIFGEGTKKEFQALNVYKGEITVLLGHNGAGKTTLISIITGMIKQSSGKIYVNGKDTVTQQDEVRRQLGFCPQHNLFFPDLTVLEHLMFFSLIKGGDFKDAKKSAYALMDQLDLIAYAGRKISNLSGGLLRRLQLGCALCGDASVLILDEPTSGLDVEARRELWDTLLNLRGDRTLVLTTHFMEEADVLGDRMAALHLGKLRCHATPMFLKKAVGSGFRINISTSQEQTEDRITPIIKDLEPGAVLNESSVKTLVYVLPPRANVLPVFKTLEEKKEELGIESLGVGVTSLEEVFLELCCDVDTMKSEICADRDPAQFQYVTGCRLLCRQTKELFKRQIDNTMSNVIAFILLHMVMPFVLCTSLTKIFNILDSDRDVDLKLDLDMYSETSFKDAFFNFRSSNRSEKSMKYMKIAFPNYYFSNILDFPYVHSLNVASKSGGTQTNLDLKRYMAGIAMNETSATILYSRNLKHSAPVGLNLFSNMLAIQNLPNAHGRTIITKLTNNWPLSTKPYHIPKTKINCSLFAIFNICTIIATTVNDLSLPCKERMTVARHTHIMAGCSPFLYWLVTLLYHMFFYMSFCCSATLVAAAFFDKDRTIDDQATLKAIFIVVTLSGVNIYAFMYFVSFLLEERSASLIVVAVAITFGFLVPILIIAVEDLKTTPGETLMSRVTNIVGLLLPVYMFTKAFMAVTTVSRFNSFCINNLDKCPDLQKYEDEFNVGMCCTKGTPRVGPFSHYGFNNYAAGKSILIIFIQIISFMSLLFLLQFGIFNRCWNKLGMLTKEMYPRPKFNDDNVQAERQYVVNKIQQGKSTVTDTLLIEKMWKIYRGVLWSKTCALKGVTFSVKKGECFGVLGLNGAGKTTTFKLISKEESVSRGQILVSGHSGGGQYLRSLGYCPQFCGLDDFRTGKANLRMLLILRGLSDEDVELEMTAWLHVVGMLRHAHREVSGYSGGMVRRLATAASLCSGAALTLLDEPTAGVDTAARRLVWAALQKGVRHNRAIAMSSHCMDEMERLCTRVTILTCGEMSVLGSPQALKEQFAPGHTVVLKLQANAVQSEFGQERISQLKNFLNQLFDCSMKEKHLTSLHYRINGKLPYSEIFTKMEKIMREFPHLIEDYSVSDTTLEDVFLAFAHQNERSLPAAQTTSRET